MVGVGKRGVAPGDLGKVRLGVAAPRPPTRARRRTRPRGRVRLCGDEQGSRPEAPLRAAPADSEPSPPLETSTRRSMVSGNW